MDNFQERIKPLMGDNYNPDAGVYTAEDKVFWAGEKEAVKKDFANDLAVDAFIESIQHSDFAKANWPKFAAGQTPKVYPDVMAVLAGYTGARTEENRKTGEMRIMLSPDERMFTKPVILHELSHVVDIRENGSPHDRGDEDGHGPDFAGIFLVMLKEFGSAEWSKELQAQFDKDKVPYNLPVYA